MPLHLGATKRDANKLKALLQLRWYNGVPTDLYTVDMPHAGLFLHPLIIHGVQWLPRAINA